MVYFNDDKGLHKLEIKNIVLQIAADKHVK